MKSMKKGLHISGLVLAVSMAAIGCQKSAAEVESEKVPVTETIIELAEDESMTEGNQETSAKQDKETKKEKEAKDDKKEALKDSKKETSKEDDKKEASEEKETSKKGTQKPSKTETDSSKPQKPTGTQKPSKPAETKPQETQKPAETEPQHQHEWAAKTELIEHPEEGHYETVVVEEAWDEPIYKATNICSVCQIDLGSTDNAGLHSAETGHSYYVGDFQVGTKHHDAVTEQQWVVDKKAWYESVIVGYECQCGATKK